MPVEKCSHCGITDDSGTDVIEFRYQVKSSNGKYHYEAHRTVCLACIKWFIVGSRVLFNDMRDHSQDTLFINPGKSKSLDPYVPPPDESEKEENPEN